MFAICLVVVVVVVNFGPRTLSITLKFGQNHVSNIYHVVVIVLVGVIDVVFVDQETYLRGVVV